MHSPRELNNKELDYWKSYGITIETLDKYNVRALEEFTYGSKIHNSSPDDPIFCYVINDSTYKIYRPLTPDKSNKFRWTEGQKPEDFIFGYNQLPDSGHQVFITGGEKDVLCLADFGFNAITMNSETQIPSKTLISELRKRFEMIVILYDIDETGINQSDKICKTFGLHQCILPTGIANKGQKDISDFVKSGFLLDDLDKYIKAIPKLIDPETDLGKILKSQTLLKEAKSHPISFSKPLLTRVEISIIYPNTINVIQGKSGTHKSRLAQTICSSLIKKNNCDLKLLNLTANREMEIDVCYVDTERNLKEQFPHAIQQILKGGGYAIDENPEALDYISLLEVDRKNRFKALKSYLNHQVEKKSRHTLIVLDVITDCLLDFNRTEYSMEIIDLMNLAIHDYNVTFLCLIHENPGQGEKARGHLGTEIINKATNVYQVGFEMVNNEPTEIIKISTLKSRNSKRGEPIYVECTDELVFEEVEEDRVLQLKDLRQTKANTNELVSWLGINLNGKLSGKQLDKLLCSLFGASSKTIRNRLDNIHFQKKRIEKDGKFYTLERDKFGRENFYYLEIITENITT